MELPIFNSALNFYFESMFIKAGASETKEGLRVEEATGKP